MDNFEVLQLISDLKMLPGTCDKLLNFALTGFKIGEARSIFPFMICISHPIRTGAWRFLLSHSAEIQGHTKSGQQTLVAVTLRVPGGQQRVPDEDRIGASQKAKRMQSVGHVLPPPQTISARS